MLLSKPKEKIYKHIGNVHDKFSVDYHGQLLKTEIADEYYKILEKNLKYNDAESSKVFVHGKYHYIKRKQVAYGEPGTKYTFAGATVYANSWHNVEDNLICDVIKHIKYKVELFCGYKFNFVLINRYKDGNDKIMAHKDKVKDLVHESPIAGVSLGAVRDVIFKADSNPKKLDKSFPLKLAHGSVFIMNYPTNQYWKHEIPSRKQVKTPRISLTFRHINIEPT